MFKYTRILANLTLKWSQEARHLPTTNIMKFFPYGVTRDFNENSQFIHKHSHCPGSKSG